MDTTSPPVSSKEKADTPPGSLSQLTRHIALAGIAGVATGVIVGGLGGRLFMRIAGATASESAQGRTTEAGFQVGEITAGGTLGLVIFIGILAGLIGAVLYVVFRSWLHWTGRWRGVAFGVVLFAVGSATSSVLDPGNIDFVILGNSLFLVLMIFALFLAFGVMIDWTYAILDRRLPIGDETQRGTRFLYGALALLGLLVATGPVFSGMLMNSRSFCDCDQPILVSVFVSVTTIGTLLWWMSGLSSRVNRLETAGRILGFTGLAGATFFGLIRAISDAVEVIS